MTSVLADELFATQLDVDQRKYWKCRAAETSEKCVRHHIHACVLALRDEIWSIITGAMHCPLATSHEHLVNRSAALLCVVADLGQAL